MTEYFRLTSPKSDRLWAVTCAGSDDQEVSLCPSSDLTRGDVHWDGQRLRTNLIVSLKHNRRDELVIWGWFDECLVHKTVLAEFKALGLSGYRLKPAKVRFLDGRVSTDYSQLVVVGWAGLAPEESGIHLVKRCPSCLCAEYSGLANPEKLVDFLRWTGDDFFVVWPLPRYLLITARVADFLRARKINSFSLQKPDTAWSHYGGFTVGRLSSSMPDDIALKYGEPLGIENRAARWTRLSELQAPGQSEKEKGEDAFPERRWQR